MRFSVHSWQGLVLLARVVLAQQILPFNLTGGTNAAQNTTLSVGLSINSDGQPSTKFAQILPLTSAASSQVSNKSIRGLAVVGTPQNSARLNHTDIVLISCDSSSYSGDIDALKLLTWAQDAMSAVIFYSLEASACQLENYTQTSSWIYTLQSSDDARKLLQRLSNTSSAIGTFLSIDSTTGPSSHNGTSTSVAAGPSSTADSTRSTTVAMIVLYSITGVITALFLSIIITGALRAHRHPERYGPRAVIGLSRQSRTKGLAKAMLDSLPIVKFGAKEATKSLDHELESGGNASSANPSHPSGTSSDSPDEQQQQQHSQQSPSMQPSSASPDVGGDAAITSAALGAAVVTTNPESTEKQGCSICTEDFEVGQDQRVLPCDHRFHPACVDPWLLNVSGTCPLCRIDLRPAQSADETRTNDDQLAPPLALSGSSSVTDGEHVSRRRSIILSMLGVPRPERLTREQRLQALRDYRLHLHRQRTHTDAATSSGSSNAGLSRPV